MKRHHWLTALLLLLTTLVFSDLPTQQFLSWDDQDTVALNRRFSPASAPSTLYFWTHPHMDLYIPVTYTVWSGVAAVAQQAHPRPGESPLSPAPFKTTSLLLHLASVLVVFALLRRLVAHDGAAFLGALLYGIHPVQVEPVAWVSGMKDVLCGLLSLVALWQYVRFAELARDDAPGCGRWIHYGAAVVAFVLALMSKPVAMALPAGAAVLDLWAVRRPLSQVARSLAPWFALALPWMLLTRHFQPAHGIGDHHPLWTRPLIAGDALAFYLTHTALPLTLTPDYGRNPTWVLRQPWGYWSWLLPAAVAALLWRFRKERPLLVAAAGISFCAVLPILGFVPFDFQYHSTVSDHYLYLAMLGPALALAWWLAKQPPRMYAVAGVVLAVLGGHSLLQSYHWVNNRAFYTHVAEANPRSWMGFSGLGATLAQEGDDAGALRAYETAVRNNPDDVKSRKGLADALDAAGHPQEAIAEYVAVLSRQPQWASAHVNLGVTLSASGRLPEAEREFMEAARIDPNLWLAYYNLGNTRARMGHRAAAEAAYREALRCNPGSAEVRLKLALLQSPAE